MVLARRSSVINNLTTLDRAAKTSRTSPVGGGVGSKKWANMRARSQLPQQLAQKVAVMRRAATEQAEADAKAEEELARQLDKEATVRAASDMKRLGMQARYLLENDAAVRLQATTRGQRARRQVADWRPLARLTTAAKAKAEAEAVAEGWERVMARLASMKKAEAKKEVKRGSMPRRHIRSLENEQDCIRKCHYSCRNKGGKSKRRRPTKKRRR